jgi:hypothetical protein
MLARVLTAFNGLLFSTFLCVTVDMRRKTSRIGTMLFLSEITGKSDSPFLCNMVNTYHSKTFQYHNFYFTGMINDVLIT